MYLRSKYFGQVRKKSSSGTAGRLVISTKWKRIADGDVMKQVHMVLRERTGNKYQAESSQPGLVLMIFPFRALLTLYREALKPARKAYWIVLLFTHKNGDFGAISHRAKLPHADLESGKSHFG